MATKVILDVDTGTDDAVAIMFAALHPEIEPTCPCTAGVGRTVMGTRTHASAPANCDVAFGADAARFVQLMLSAFEISAFGRTTSASP